VALPPWLAALAPHLGRNGRNVTATWSEPVADAVSTRCLMRA